MFPLIHQGAAVVAVFLGYDKGSPRDAKDSAGRLALPGIALVFVTFDVDQGIQSLHVGLTPFEEDLPSVG